MSSVSVVVPASSSDPTVDRVVDSLLQQTYPGPVEIILVGDVDPGGARFVRAPAWAPSDTKRNLGLEAATGDVLCMVDGDVVPARDWVETGVALLNAGWSCAAGPVASVDAGFWGAYVDGNAFARMGHEYVASRATLGRQGHKPPATANLFVAAELYERVGGLRPERGEGEWFQRIVDAGYPILCTPRLVAYHHRHQGWGRLPADPDHAGRARQQIPRELGAIRFTRRRVC